MLRVFILVVASLTVACARPAERPIGPGAQTPVLAADHIIAADGYRLPLYRWLPDDDPRAVVLALHGFNDYGGSFNVLADGFNARGIALYAYDQRGFGASEPRGIWAGEERLVDDAMVSARLLQERYPEQPLFLIGKSMGSAVTMLVLTHEDAPSVAGSILIAPAVWGEEVMPWYQQFGLWLGDTVTPGMRLSADLAQGLGIAPTDDEAVLQELRENPMVQREARIDAIEGLSHLMDSALQVSGALPGPTLILYGEQDEIIPAEPICLMLERLPDRQRQPWRMVLYPDGYHMLTRYTGAEQVHEDINAWLQDIDGELPSGHEVNRQGARDILCH